MKWRSQTPLKAFGTHDHVALHLHLVKPFDISLHAIILQEGIKYLPSGLYTRPNEAHCRRSRHCYHSPGRKRCMCSASCGILNSSMPLDFKTLNGRNPHQTPKVIVLQHYGMEFIQNPTECVANSGIYHGHLIKVVFTSVYQIEESFLMFYR